MLRKLSDVRAILGILLVLVILVGSLVGYLYYSKFNKEITTKDQRITELENGITQIGQLVPAYKINADVKMGKEIKETDLTPIEVPISMATNLIQRMDELEGKHYKLDLTEGTAISKDVVTEIELTDDIRLMDLVLDTIPVGIEVGDYVDVRISLPLGEDFIAIAHRQVYDVNGGVLKVAVDQEDIYAYNSMLVDSLIYPGTSIYAVEYLEGGVQKAANTYYPVSKGILAVAEKDPNLINAIKLDMLKRRDALDATLSTVKIPAEELDRILERGRQNLSADIENASREYQRRMEKLEADRKREERQNNGN